MSNAEIKRIKASELTPDIRNANRGTERGRYALETSLRDLGAGRSILVDAKGRIIAGNKTLETAADIGLDDVLVVQTDGTQIVAVQRMDLDLAQDDKARMLAYADNRVGQLDLDFDPEIVAEDIAAGLDLSAFWQDFELDELTVKSFGDEIDPSLIPDNSGYLEQYGVIVVCKNVAEQEKIYNRLAGEGYSVKVVTT